MIKHFLFLCIWLLPIATFAVDYSAPNYNTTTLLDMYQQVLDDVSKGNTDNVSEKLDDIFNFIIGNFSKPKNDPKVKETVRQVFAEELLFTETDIMEDVLPIAVLHHMSIFGITEYINFDNQSVDIVMDRYRNIVLISN